MKFSRDAWAGLAVLAASLFLFWLTLELKDSPLVPIGPGYYPRIVLGVTAALALALVVSALLERRRARPAGGGNYAAVGLHFALFALYVLAMPGLGFRLATAVYLAAANALLDWPKGPKGWIRVFALALIVTAVVYFVFERYLFVLLPRGRWTGF